MRSPCEELSDVCEIIMGQAPAGDAYNDKEEGYPLVAGAGDFGPLYPSVKKHTTEASKLSRAGDIILGIRASIGSKVLSDKEYCLGRGVAGLRASPRLEIRYLWHWLEEVRMELLSKGRGATFLQVNRQDIRELQIPLPPLAEQKRIAAILDAADALRAKRREALAQLDALLQSSFLTLFGDPVVNPMGWPQVELGDLVADDDRINYGVVQPGDEYPGGRPLIRVGDFVGGELDLSGIKFIDPKIDAQYERSRLLGTELLVSCVGSIGTVCRVPLSAKGHNIARAVARVPLSPKVEREFMLFCLRSFGVQNYFTNETRTVSQPTLNIGLIKTATVTVPPLPLQQKFAAIVESVERQKAAQRAHLAELDALFAALQHRAFRGEL